jgi:hypothetical protein
MSLLIFLISVLEMVNAEVLSGINVTVLVYGYTLLKFALAFLSI